VYGLLRTALFTTSPETAHELALESLRLAHTLGATRFMCRPARDPARVMGLEFPNRVGLAAGMDKNGDYIDALGSLGFGFIEIGTVTPRPQPGNPRPRVFRIARAEAMINRLGFNNKGVDHLVARVRERRYPGILGINIGKNFDTPNERAVDDYLCCLDKVYPHADYVTINISSPNTAGLRELQAEQALRELLGSLAERRSRLADQHGRRVPIAVKVAPDLNQAAIASLAQVVSELGMDAVIATNTTVARPGVAGMPHAEEGGGLSGGPLREMADEVLASLRSALPPEIALIGVGGITRGEHAAHKRQLGADLVQFYTGFVYRGPDLIAECVEAMQAAQAAA
jgi:dihydroorotate dehydrogenase